MKTHLINFIAVIIFSPFFAHSSGINAVIKSGSPGKDKGEIENAKYTIFYDKINESFNLIYKTYSTQPVRVYIYNDQHELIYTDKIKESGILSRPYNFKNMMPGFYTFKIVERHRVVFHKLAYAPVLDESHYQVNVLPLENHKYALSVVGEVPKPVTLRILNENKGVVHSETINENASFSKIYNLHKISLKKCTFEVSVSDNIIFYKSF